MDAAYSHIEMKAQQVWTTKKNEVLLGLSGCNCTPQKSYMRDVNTCYDVEGLMRKCRNKCTASRSSSVAKP